MRRFPYIGGTRCPGVPLAMRLTHYFLPVLSETPAEAQIVSATG